MPSPDLQRKSTRFISRLSKIVGSTEIEARSLASTTSSSSYWINPLRGDTNETQKELKEQGIESEEIDWLPFASTLTSDKKTLASSPSFKEGRIYIQNLSSMIAIHALVPQPGDSILDICASPGGKSARAAALTANEIQLWANDSIKPRVTKMKEVFDHLGVQAMQVTQHPGQYVDKYIDQMFDKIILDTQCSGEARINPNHPTNLRYWSEERISKMSYLQQKMLSAAWKLVRPGGVIIYSTCTYAPEENESPVSFLLKHHRDAEIESVEIPLKNKMPGLSGWNGSTFDQRLKNAVRILPSEYTEAFFLCKIRKSA
jgi:16S rRNA C967 or C1407 C5-methylase (RsmB/RsmF family)